MPRPALEQSTDFEQIDDLVQGKAARCRRQQIATIAEVFLGAQVWKEQVVLKHVANAAVLRRPINALGRGEEGLAVQGYFAAVRPHQSGDHVEQRGLARARRAVDGGNGVVALDIDVEREGA